MGVLRWIAAVCLLALGGQAVAQTRTLPDFPRLVEEQGPAVVNISTKQEVKRRALPKIPGIGDDELQEFFRRFMPRQPIPAPAASSTSITGAESAKTR